MRTAIDFPELDQKDIQAYYAQMRPTREGGNRLAKANLDGKCIVHNYGHGGAGVSLAPGCAIEAVRLASQQLKSNNSGVAVIGSGVIGLMNALYLSKEYPTTKIAIYSERIPNFGQKDNNKLITSEVAPGYWLPYGYGHTDNKLHEHLSTLSYNQYLALKEQSEYKNSLKEVEVYDISDENFKKDTFKVLTKELKETVKNIKVTLNGKTTVDCMYFKTIKIDMQPFLNSLILSLKKRNVEFVTKKINNLAQLNERIIFNCVGQGSKQMIDDNLMKGVKGHLIEYKNPNPSKFNYFIKTNVGNQAMRYYMHDSRILLGLTRQDQEDSLVDNRKIDLLKNSHQQVLQKFGITPIKPKL